MINALDSINIGLIGGPSVGKTTLLRRLAEKSFPGSYEATQGFNVMQAEIPLKDSLSVPVKVIDFASCLLPLYYERENNRANPLTQLIPRLQAAFLVLDVTDKQSVLYCNHWLDLVHRLTRHSQESLITIILAHKADIPLNQRQLTARQLDRLCLSSSSMLWAYTVGESLVSSD